ncbi:hypothetical protein KSC_079460 [Ktedonobacter sp. SOSP1-52]|uniref:FAD-dependent oxidoreductase n=1 Tax=Ktedonobacter sp. SOSP1-52 TaxID=2778366 RepID=UPI00191568AD|nr:FAD-dependent oxidoreductase [Ktedonobacter sp. SOSP1-52]GHO69054.1 hypothetical protein KSC_079460 [Ktedonobacter sp. SOSP1-52]
MSNQVGKRYVIIGNGIAAITAAEVLRQEDTSAAIVMLSNDEQPVLYRPALKDYLAGRLDETRLPARTETFYQEHDIHFYADPAVGLDTQQQYVRLKSGKKLRYSRLLLACGARPARLQCQGNDLKGVVTLRNLEDYQELMGYLPRARHIVVCGSGTLALETIETLRQQGHEVTHLVRKRTLWSEILDETASDLVLQQERRDGVQVRRATEIAEVTGRQGRVHALLTSSGEALPCDLLICAIGIEPNLDCIEGSNIAHGRGIHVNAFMRTSTPNVYAAGDIVEIQDPLTQRMRVLGQWYPAIQQARTAAYSMLDLLDPQHDTPSFQAQTFYNATFLYGLPFAATGHTYPSGGQGLQEIIADPEPRSYRKVLLKNGVPIGMLGLGNRAQALAFKRAIDHRVQMGAIAFCLFLPDFNLNNWLDSQGVPPPLLGANLAGKARAATPEQGTTPARQQQPGAQPRPAIASPLPTTDKKPALKPEEKPQRIDWYLVPDTNVSQWAHIQPLQLSKSEKLFVGRQPGSHLLLDMETISRTHAEIFFTDGRYVLRDLGSTNGIFINGYRMPPRSVHFLQENEEISFGSRARFICLCHTHDGPDTAPLAPLKGISEKLPIPLMGMEGNTGGLMRRFATATAGSVGKTEKIPALQVLTELVAYKEAAHQRSTPLPGLVICRCCGIANTQKARFCASCSAPLDIESKE